MKINSINLFLLTLLGAAIVTFVVDPLDPTTLSTPFCLAMILMALSFRQKPWLVVSTTIFYNFLVLYAMFHFMAHAIFPFPHPYFWFFQRYGMFLIVCCMGIYMTYYRDGMERNLIRIQALFSKLPAPVAVSDEAGYITYVNEPLCSFFQLAASSLMGKRYIDVFMATIQEGKAASYYNELFKMIANTSHDIELGTAGITGNTKGCLICLGEGKQRNLITVLQPHLKGTP